MVFPCCGQPAPRTHESPYGSPPQPLLLVGTLSRTTLPFSSSGQARFQTRLRAPPTPHPNSLRAFLRLGLKSSQAQGLWEAQTCLGKRETLSCLTVT